MANYYTRDRYKFRTNIWQEPRLPRILIEGDSWTDHPLVANLAWALHLYLKNKVHILNISHSGDLITDMGTGHELANLKDIVGTKVYGIDLLFLSGGGNDILVHDDPKFHLSLLIKSANSMQPADYINWPLFETLLGEIEKSYRAIISSVTEARSNIQILTHNYDWVYPRDNGADFIVRNISGPWVDPVMRLRKIQNQQLQRDIICLMLARFSQLLDQLQQEIPNFSYVNTQGVLPQHLGSWGKDVAYWDDEIHPDSAGFALLVEKAIGPAVKNLIA